MELKNEKIRIFKNLMLILLLSIYVISATAQNSIKIIEKWRINKQDVKDLTINNNRLLMVSSKNEITQFDTATKKTLNLNIAKSSSNFSGLTTCKNDIYYIDNKGNILKKNDSLIKKYRLPKNFHTKLLASSDSLFFTCFLDNKGMSYSNRIVSIDKTNKDTLFAFLQGIPGGMCYNDNYLWYLARQGILIKYNLDTKKWNQVGKLPINNVNGLAISNGILFTYDTTGKQIIKFQISKN